MPKDQEPGTHANQESIGQNEEESFDEKHHGQRQGRRLRKALKPRVDIWTAFA